MKTNHLSFLIFFLCLTIYSITNYGGIRAPDSEVVFRTAESIAQDGNFSVSSGIESWPGFGVARGLDGARYSVYPPGESLAIAPIIAAAEKINETHWYENFPVPVSHYIGDALRNMLTNIPEKNIAPHALRFLVSFFDVMIGACTVLVFWLLLLKMTQSAAASLATAVVFAFGTLAWNYAGSFFSEPLATLLVLLSFYFLHINDSNKLKLSLSGIFLGMAVATHMTAVLFAPFFCIYQQQNMKTQSTKNSLLFWLMGFFIVLGLLGYYNWTRFGSILETGRNLSSENQISFVSPFSANFFKNLYGLLLSPGKGLLILCPAVLLGLYAWRHFDRTHRLLSRVLIAAAAVRMLFNAAYADWHAGFGLGPRYLFMIVPFLLIPFAFWLKANLEKPRALWIAAGAAWLCIIQQWYFAVGEIFSYYHIVKWSYANKGVNVFLNDRLYWDWKFTPVFHLLDFRRGPFLLQSIPISNESLWMAGCLVWAMIIVAAVFYWSRKNKISKPTKSKNRVIVN